jgi:hypothetical protein
VKVLTIRLEVPDEMDSNALTEHAEMMVAGLRADLDLADGVTIEIEEGEK